MSHLKNLLRHVPALRSQRILDLGAGKGYFLLDVAREGIDVEGLEYNPAYVERARLLLRNAGYNVIVTEGPGESVPYQECSFDFVNASEVIEHVQDPEQVLREVFRILTPGGSAYVSIPNRFGMKDPHYKLYGVNWLPRAWSDQYIALFGRSKKYGDLSAGHQRLSEMHYFTYPAFSRLAEEIGFSVMDIRAQRIADEYGGVRKWLAQLVYPLLRCVYFDSFHVLLNKPTAP